MKQNFYLKEHMESLVSEAKITYGVIGFLTGMLAMFGLMVWIGWILGLQ